MNKLIIRWNVGPVKTAGLHILKKSVSNISRIYPQANLIITYNQIEKREIEFLEEFNVDFIKQESNKVNKGYQVHWKLYPARLDNNSHEICIDNDILIFDRIEEIDNFINDDATLISEGLHGAYGQYKDQIPYYGLRFNSGIYGVPPKFDINQMIEKEIRPWGNKFDEQGLISIMMHRHKNMYIIPLTKIPIVESEFDINMIKRIKTLKGIHFVGANCNVHNAWLNYQNQII